jgi:hypothetical protein
VVSNLSTSIECIITFVNSVLLILPPAGHGRSLIHFDYAKREKVL